MDCDPATHTSRVSIRSIAVLSGLPIWNNPTSSKTSTSRQLWHQELHRGSVAIYKSHQLVRIRRVGLRDTEKLTSEDHDAGRGRLKAMKEESVLGQFLASALAGNAVLGSVFYALPAVVAVGGVYSPISLFIARLILFLWRPIMEELASALPISGAPYTYILNVSTRGFALIGASLLLLDFASTAVVSAATAATYLAGEVPGLPFPAWVGTVIVLVIFTIVSLMGVQESARIALVVLSFHISTMIVLIVASSIHWGKIGIQ